MPPPTSHSATRVTSPPSRIDAFAVVPPMSKVMTSPCPTLRAISLAPTTPAAGPDSMMWIGRSDAASTPMEPPLDCMIRSGAWTPRPRSASASDRR